jgi:hypothetical protein
MLASEDWKTTIHNFRHQIKLYITHKKYNAVIAEAV